MLWALLRLLCALQLGAALALLAGGEALRDELLGFARVNALQVRQARLGVAGIAGLCLLWSSIGRAAGAVPPVEAERDVTLALAAAALAWLLGCCLEAADELALLRRARSRGAEAGEELAAARQQLAAAAAEAEQWKEAAGKLELQVVAIRKQAEGQAEEYMRLMSENKSLRNQLADFDLVMGGSRKKVA
mmetsp:Transcript_29661/g.92412  ORF Transcript_29661/g.92412 Transcript_29661/m.92412 type:complete len:190 (-) Transcript_29661:52-621(-)